MQKDKFKRRPGILRNRESCETGLVNSSTSESALWGFAGQDWNVLSYLPLPAPTECGESGG